MSVFIEPQGESAYGLLGKSLGQGTAQGLSQSLNQMLQEKQIKKAEADYVKQGLPPALARLAAVAPVGGQTAIFQTALDEYKRRGSPQAMQQEQQRSENKIESQEPEYENPDLGLTPSERVGREKERYKTGLPVYQETGIKLRGLQRDKERFDILENLDKGNKLPQNFGRLNVDKTGNLLFPFAASPEAQRFVKTLNEFSASAKDTFGSRVTNFDLQQYLLRYPTLLNNKEGRKQLLQQMKIVNQINSTYYKNLKNTYDKAGGVRKIDADVAERIAEEKSEPIVNKLAEKFEEIGSENKITMRDPQGNLRSVQKSDVDAATKAGYKLEQ